jgi:hypothetical protein
MSEEVYDKLYDRPSVNIIGENEQMNEIIKDRLIESQFYSSVHIDTVKNENTDITVCASLSKYNELNDYYGIKVLFTGAAKHVIGLANIDSETLIIYKSLNSIQDLPQKIYNYYIKTKGK